MHDVTHADEGHGQGCAVKEINDRHRAENARELAKREHARAHDTVEPPREFADDGLISFKTEWLAPEQRDHVRRTMREQMTAAEFTLNSVAYALSCSKYDEWRKDRAAWETRMEPPAPVEQDGAGKGGSHGV
jgi:hypothetical protein